MYKVGLTSTKSVQAKFSFEREAASFDITIFKDYYTNNGVYVLWKFTSEHISKGQGIKHSGVSGHHHNGIAKIAIKHDDDILGPSMA